MGYDMYWVDGGDDDERKAVEAANAAFHAAIAARNALPEGARGSWGEGEFAAAVQTRTDAIPANATPEYRAAQAAVTEAYEASVRAERSYFRLNVWGMQTWRAVMEHLDMLRWRDESDPDEEPGWPTRELPDDQEDDYYEWYRNWGSGAEREAREAEYEAEHPGRVAAWREIRAAEVAKLSWVPINCFRVVIERDGNEVEALDESPQAIYGAKFGSNDGWLITPRECARAAAKGREAQKDGRMREAFLAAGVDWDPEERWEQWLAFLEGAVDRGGVAVW